MRVSEGSVDGWLEAIDDKRAEEARQLDAIISEVFAEDSRVLWVGKF